MQCTRVISGLHFHSFFWNWPINLLHQSNMTKATRFSLASRKYHYLPDCRAGEDASPLENEMHWNLEVQQPAKAELGKSILPEWICFYQLQPCRSELPASWQKLCGTGNCKYWCSIGMNIHICACHRMFTFMIKCYTIYKGGYFRTFWSRKKSMFLATSLWQPSPYLWTLISRSTHWSKVCFTWTWGIFSLIIKR